MTDSSREAGPPASIPAGGDPAPTSKSRSRRSWILRAAFAGALILIVLVFHNALHGILISGDALWENGFGFVMPPEIDPAALPATRATIDMLAGLDVRVVIPGHGEPFTGVAAALDRALRRVAAFEADSVRVARHALKVNLMFSLLDKQRMPLAEMPDYVARVGLYRDFNARFFGLPPAKLAELLVGELERAGAARRVDGWLTPAAA